MAGRTVAELYVFFSSDYLFFYDLSNCVNLIRLIFYYDAFHNFVKERKEAKIRNRYNQVPHPTQNTVWESDKYTAKRYIHESQEVSPFQAGDHKAARHRQDNMKKTNKNKKIFKGSIALNY